MRLWRVVPCDPKARPGERFSSEYIPPLQGSGRFDLESGPVIYLAETPEHAIGEKLARYRGARLRSDHLMEFHHQLALVPVDVTSALAGKIMDLCDPAAQMELGIRSDQLAAADRSITQDIAARVGQHGYGGLRWWSSIRGEWHTVVVFIGKRTTRQLTFGAPEFLSLEHSSVLEAAKVLRMQIKELKR